MSDVEASPQARFGKWAQAAVPHRGWECTNVYDLGPNASMVCEMCEHQSIRYVHVMRHDDWPEELECGCVCAGNMEEDYVGARERERALRNASGRRRNWLKREWRVSNKGNDFINTRGFNVVVWPADGGWCFRVQKEAWEWNLTWPADKALATAEEAKLRAFDALVWMERRWKREREAEHQRELDAWLRDGEAFPYAYEA